MSSFAKESKWNDEAHAALAGALGDALVEAGSAPAKHRETIISSMSAKGHEFTWEAIR